MKQNLSKTILIIGGHLTPALALIDELDQSDFKLIYLGRKYTGPTDSLSIERTEITARKVKFVEFLAPKLHRKPLTKNINELPKSLRSLQQANQILTQYQPDVIISFGGYLALPVALVARLKKIPLITHEQTTVMGLTNRLISRFAQTVAISWKNTTKLPQKIHSKTLLTGNPIRPVFTHQATKPDWLNTTLPIIYITGGNQGSRTINHAVLHYLEKLTNSYFIVHQTGSTAATKQLRLSQIVNSLPRPNQKNYYHRSWFGQLEVAWLLQNSSLTVSRAGANTITELLVNSTNSLLIPLPTSAGQEQHQNAQILEEIGLARILSQDNLTHLLEAIHDSIHNPPKPIKSKINKLAHTHTQAAKTLAKIVTQCASNTSEKPSNF